MTFEDYRYETSSISGFIQQLAVSYVSNGYFFYVVGRVPAGKDARAIDRKLVGRYGVHVSKWAKARRKQAGGANLQYLRHGHLFVLLATHGHHPFFTEEGELVRDMRRIPLKAFGYAVSFKGQHVHVRIEREEFKRLKAYFLGLATHRRADTIAAELFQLPFEPYAPVRRQLLELWRLINKARRAAGFDLVPIECLRLRRRIVKPFENQSSTLMPAA